MKLVRALGHVRVLRVLIVFSQEIVQTFSTRKGFIDSDLRKLKKQEEKRALYFLWEEE